MSDSEATWGLTGGITGDPAADFSNGLEGHHNIKQWTSEEVCLDTRGYFERVYQAILGARQSVVLEMYIFRLDVLGNRLLEALRDTASRGVSVRIIVDGVGSPQFNAEFVGELKADGIDARIYHPAPTFSLQLPSLNKLRRFFANINKRNHRKLIIIDDAVAFVGSCNIADMHRNWRETAVSVSGRSVGVLSRSFELIWTRSNAPGVTRSNALKARLQARRKLGREREAGSQGPVCTNYTRRLRVGHNANIAARIERAKSRVWITNAYFVPSAVIVTALLRAARNGCDVKLILPGKTDVGLVTCVSRMFYVGLMRAGVQIFEYQPTVLHAKTLLVDDWACVGTTNLNHRSFYHDLEVDVALSTLQSRQLLAEQFSRDLAVSKLVTADGLRRRPMFEKIGGYLVYPFKSFI